MKRCILEGTRIWQGDPEAKDTYVDFKGSFRTEGTGRVFLRISADSNYTVWVNGQVAGFSGCADYPDFRRFDRIAPDESDHVRQPPTVFCFLTFTKERISF